MKAIVTGHSRGLGAAVAAELMARGVPVLGLSRKTNTELGQRFPSLLKQVALDLADSAALAQWMAGGEFASFLDGGDTVLLVNNAGVVQPVGPLAAQPVNEVARAVALNVAAPLMLAAALCATGQAGERRILHISSGAARNAYPGWSVYCATKAALDHHARAVALDRLPGVRICSLAPGVIDTGMQAEIRSASLANFPLRERFDAMKRDGSLSSPAACAQRLADYLLGPRFGEAPVADLRDF